MSALKRIGRVRPVVGSLSLIPSLILSLILSLVLAASASAQVVVETFTATETYDFVMPGTPGASGIDFNYTHSFDTISFTPGSVTFGDVRGPTGGLLRDRGLLHRNDRHRPG